MGLNLLDHVGPGGKRVLTIKNCLPPSNRSMLPGDEHFSITDKLTPEQRLEADLYVALRAHREVRRRSGLFGTKLLKPWEADRALRDELARVQREDVR